MYKVVSIVIKYYSLVMTFYESDEIFVPKVDHKSPNLQEIHQIKHSAVVYVIL